MRNNFLQTKHLLVVLIVLVVLGFSTVLLQSNSKQTTKPISTPTTTKPTSKNPPSDPTANWKVFTNENYQYEIKYPKEWNTIVSIRKGERTDPIPVHGDQPKGIVINLNKNYPNSRTQPFLEITAEDESTEEYFKVRKSSWGGIEITFNGNAAIKSTIVSNGDASINLLPGNQTNLLVFSRNNRTIYEIICNEDISNKGFCDQILSTFRFLDDPSKP